MRILLAAGADPNATDAEGNPLLYFAIEEEDWVRFFDRAPSTETLRILIEAGADVNARSAEGVSPLEQAVRDGHPDIVKILVDAGAE